MEKEYYSSVAFYRDQRGLNNSSLAEASGISRPTIIKICAGDLSPGKDNQQKLADTLHIETEDLIFCSDPETVKKKVVNIEEITQSILASFSALPPHMQRKKANKISAFLFMNDTELEAAIRYLMLEANFLGRSIPSLALSSNPPESALEQQQENSDFPTALEAYRVQRNLSKTTLANNAHIERHVVSQLCNGTQKPSQPQLRALALALKVDYVDLVRDLEPDSSLQTPIINMEQEKRKILQAIACCKPQRLKNIQEIILAYLHNFEKNIESLLECLLSSASPNKANVLEVIKALIKQRWSYSDAALSEINIEIGYYRSEAEDNLYNAYVLFGDGICSFFHLESPLSKIHYPESELFSVLPQAGIDFPIPIYTDLTPEDDDFESELLDQVMQSLISETEGMPPKLFNIFSDYLDDSLCNANIIEYTGRDLDLTLPFRIRTKEKQYDKIFSEMRSNIERYDQFQKEIVKTFSRMREDPEYEQQILKKYRFLDT